jgi:hypothetical protein
MQRQLLLAAVSVVALAGCSGLPPIGPPSWYGSPAGDGPPGNGWYAERQGPVYGSLPPMTVNPPQQPENAPGDTSGDEDEPEPPRRHHHWEPSPPVQQRDAPGPPIAEAPEPQPAPPPAVNDGPECPSSDWWRICHFFPSS